MKRSSTSARDERAIASCSKTISGSSHSSRTARLVQFDEFSRRETRMAGLVRQKERRESRRTGAMTTKIRAKPTLQEQFPPAPIPSQKTLAALRVAAAGCTACPLYRNATQTVFGEGARHARLVLVGEQPGDSEDRAGRPFVGPAGGLLNRALEEAGIDRATVYVTNAVKHFKWEP